jgi:hypothetical protein
MYTILCFPPRMGSPNGQGKQRANQAFEAQTPTAVHTAMLCPWSPRAPGSMHTLQRRLFDDWRGLVHL